MQKPPAKSTTARGRFRPSGYEAHRGTSSSEANLAQEARPTKRPRAGADETSQKPQMSRHGPEGVVRVRARHVLRERVRDPGKGKGRRQTRPPEAPPDEREPDQREAVEQERAEVGSREIVPLAAPAVGEVAGDVRDVVDRPVGVAAVVGRLAATVRLDPIADVAVRVRGPALLALVHGHVAVGHLALVDDSLRADDPRVADVDDVRGLDVEPDPEAGDEDRQRSESPHGPDRPVRRTALPRATEPDPCHSAEAGRRGAGRQAAPR